MISTKLTNIKSITDCTFDFTIKPGVHLVTGENGIGKSTLFSALSQLVYRQALNSYLKFGTTQGATVSFSHNDTHNTWIRNDREWVLEHNAEPIRFNGFYEAGVLFGTRFDDMHKSKLANLQKIPPQDLKTADPFITRPLGYILRKDEHYYSDLESTASKTAASRHGFKDMVYFKRCQTGKYSQFNMSSGELLVIQLLTLIQSHIIRYRRDESTKLIILDEIDLALHPAAQERLVIFLTAIAHKFNVCVLFSAHSSHIAKSLPPEQNIHITSSANNRLKCTSPCHPYFITRNVFTHDGYDFIIFVEDELADIYINKIISDNSLKKSKLIRIFRTGGWQNTIDLQKEFENSKIAGCRTQIASVLDGDIKEEFTRRYAGDKQAGGLKKYFLPIASIEKYYSKLMNNDDEDNTIERLGDAHFQRKSIFEIKEQSKELLPKKLFSSLLDEMELQGIAREQAKTSLCNFAVDNNDNAGLKKFLTQLLTEKNSVPHDPIPMKILDQLFPS